MSKKTVSFFITLVMLFGPVSVFAANTRGSADTGCFQDFVIDQVQKNFSNTVSPASEKEHKTPQNTATVCAFNDSQNNAVNNKILKSQYRFISADRDNIKNEMFNRDLRRQRMFCDGLSEYKMKLNSFMAVSAFNGFEYSAAFI